MKYQKYQLFNTETEQIEAVAELDPEQVKKMNQILLRRGEPQRWVIVRGDD
jgi:hypothetical protein